MCVCVLKYFFVFHIMHANVHECMHGIFVCVHVCVCVHVGFGVDFGVHAFIQCWQVGHHKM